jgi:hypothetical protein
MEGRREEYGVLVWKPEGKRPLGSVGVDGRVILKCVIKKSFGRTWDVLTCLRNGNDPSV